MNAITKPMTEALALAELAFADPEFLSNADGSEMQLMLASECFVEVVAYRHFDETGDMPSGKVMADAITLLAERGSYALAISSPAYRARYCPIRAAEQLATLHDDLVSRGWSAGQ